MREAVVGPPEELPSGSRCMRSRSQAATVWSVQDMLILVNEIAAVEGDCQNALSTHQKWTIIAETCTALGVVRNVNQCRKKWQSLLAEYNLIKEWKLNYGCDSYWSLGCERRKEAGLPLDFDKDLYKAIEDFTNASDRQDTDPEYDIEAGEVDVLNVEQSGPKHKRRRRRSVPQKELPDERNQPVLAMEPVKREVVVVDQREQILTAKLMENTQQIHAILEGNGNESIDEGLTDIINEEALKIEKVRRKADKLVACLGDLARNLELFSSVVDIPDQATFDS